MTVAEIICALSKYPPEMRVLIDDADGWWNEVIDVIGPSLDGLALPTLVAGAAFDTRSL